MKKAKIINFGEDFNRKKNILEGFNTYLSDFKTLRQCFTRWSNAKENIYNKYYNLLKNNCDKIINYGIRSYNSMIIVLHAIVIKDGIKYYLMITPTYNWYIEIEGE